MHAHIGEGGGIVLVAFQWQQFFVYTYIACHLLVIFKFGVIFDELNSIFSVCVCYIFDLFLYLLILHPVGFSASHGFLECVRNK